MGKHLHPSDYLGSNTWAGSSDHADGAVALIEARPFVGECIGHALSTQLSRAVQTFATVEDFAGSSSLVEPWLILIGASTALDLEDLSEQIAAASRNTQAPIVVLADEEDLGHIRVAIG